MSPGEIRCPACGEDDQLRGERSDDEIAVECLACGEGWVRSLHAGCPTCGGGDLQEVPVAIVEKGRGSQLSVVGIRHVSLCSVCDRDSIRRWQDNRPNPLLPDQLPNADQP